MPQSAKSPGGSRHEQLPLPNNFFSQSESRPPAAGEPPLGLASPVGWDWLIALDMRLADRFNRCVCLGALIIWVWLVLGGILAGNAVAVASGMGTACGLIASLAVYELIDRDRLRTYRRQMQAAADDALAELEDLVAPAPRPILASVPRPTTAPTLALELRESIAHWFAARGMQNSALTLSALADLAAEQIAANPTYEAQAEICNQHITAIICGCNAVNQRQPGGMPNIVRKQ